MVTKKKVVSQARSVVQRGGGLVFDHDHEAHERAATVQRAAILADADDIEAGRPVPDPRFTAAVLRHAASLIPLTKPKARGHQPEFDAGGLALHYGRLRVVDGLSDKDALAALDVAYVEVDLSPVSIRRALTPAVKAEAMRQAEGAVPIKHKRVSNRKR